MGAIHVTVAIRNLAENERGGGEAGAFTRWFSRWTRGLGQVLRQAQDRLGGSWFEGLTTNGLSTNGLKMASGQIEGAGIVPAPSICPLWPEPLPRRLRRSYSSPMVKGMTPGMYHFSQVSSTLSWKYFMSSAVRWANRPWRVK